jgi:uncharacterized repeat protein (TIGR01451 family)
LPDLEVKKDQLFKSCLPGALCSFSITLINHGPSNWTGFPAITDKLPAGAKFVSSSAWICTQAGDKVTCQSPVETTLAPGETRTITITVQMPEKLEPGTENCAEINLPNANPDNDHICDPFISQPAQLPDLEGRKFQLGPCTPVGLCKFDLWFVNRGPVEWKGKPKLQDLLPPRASLVSGANCTQQGTTVTCEGPEMTLPVGKGARVTVTVQMPPDMHAGAKNCVRPIGATRDPIPQNDEHCIPVEIAEAPKPTPEAIPTPAPDTAIEKAQVGTCRAGGVCVFDLKFINKGPGAWTGRPKLLDRGLPGAKLSNAYPSTWACLSGGSFNCESETVTVAEGQSISLIVSLTVPADLANGTQNCVTLETPSEGPRDLNPENNEHCIQVEVVEIPTYAPHPPPVVAPPSPPPIQVPPPVEIQPPVIALPPTGVCPPGTHLEDHRCVKPCPPGTYKRGKVCIRRVGCPPGTIRRGDQCVRIGITIPSTCPPGTHLEHGVCVRTHLEGCPPGTVRHGKTCVRVTRCPHGTTEVGGKCITIKKPPRDHAKVKPHDHEKVKPTYDHGKRKVRPTGRGKSHVTPHRDRGKAKAGSRTRLPGAGRGGGRGGGKKGKRGR